MTDDQRKDLARDRMKAAGQDMVTVPKKLLARVLAAADLNSIICKEDGVENLPEFEATYLMGRQDEHADIVALRKAAGIDQ